MAPLQLPLTWACLTNSTAQPAGARYLFLTCGSCVPTKKHPNPHPIPLATRLGVPFASKGRCPLQTAAIDSQKANLPSKKLQQIRIIYLIEAVPQGVPFMGVASFKEEKAHFAAKKKGPENRKNEVKLPPPLKHSMTYANSVLTLSSFCQTSDNGDS